MDMNRRQLASRIDHTLLRPEASGEEILSLCATAKELGAASVCINPRFVALAAESLRDSGVMVCTVVGFPLGSMTSAAKAFETAQAVADGAEEIDMVLAVGALKEHDYDYVSADVRAVVEAAQGRTVKVIFETCLLSNEDIIAACRICEGAEAQFIKTSTGFSSAGATLEHVRLMKAHAGPMQVKAAGGIRTLSQALAMLAAGADRLGCSATREILNGLEP